MSLLERFVFILQKQMQTPALYGWYHILCLGLVAAATILLCVFLRDAGKWKVRLILSLSLAAMVILETAKQLIFSLTVTDGVAVWEYSWYAFPYQFCSTPIYVLPFAILLPEGRAKDAAIAFLSSFSLFGGLAVMLYPGDVFTSDLVINIQTMVHHGLQVVLGIYLAVHERHKLGRRYFYGAVAVFGIAVAVALTLDIAMHYVLLACGLGDHTFNMFFISPFHDCTLPLLSLVQPHLPYLAFLILYIVGFSLVAGLMHAIVYGVLCLLKRKSYDAL